MRVALAKRGARDNYFVIPGRREAAGPESIVRSAGIMDSGLAAFGRAPE
jgi:hypothetical protein